MRLDQMDEALLRAETERAELLDDENLRLSIRAAIGRRNRAAAATIGREMGHSTNSLRFGIMIEPQTIVDAYRPEHLFARLQVASARADAELLVELEDLATHRAVLPSDAVVLACVKETLKTVSERVEAASAGANLLRPTAAEV